MDGRARKRNMEPASTVLTDLLTDKILQGGSAYLLSVEQGGAALGFERGMEEKERGAACKPSRVG
jgi:hypothetical protein